jgi:hypothetical protein
MSVTLERLEVMRRTLTGGHLLGRLMTPSGHYSRPAETAAAVPWAADCDGFGEFDPDAFRRMLAAIAGLPGALFVVAPDAFGDHAATLALWDDWHQEIRDAGHPPAFVLQPGVEVETVPWATAGALFLGGPDEHRARPAIRAIADEGRRRGLHLHVGRVNGPRRALDAHAIGADSIDGSGLARWTRATLDPVLRTVHNLVTHPPTALAL